MKLPGRVITGEPIVAGARHRWQASRTRSPLVSTPRAISLLVRTHHEIASLLS
jgi:hypothetical protein